MLISVAIQRAALPLFYLWAYGFTFAALSTIIYILFRNSAKGNALFRGGKAVTVREKAERLYKKVGTFILSCVGGDGYPSTTPQALLRGVSLTATGFAASKGQLRRRHLAHKVKGTKIII